MNEDKEFYRQEIIKMVERMESCESLYKIFSFVRVFYGRDNHKIYDTPSCERKRGAVNGKL